MMRNDYIKKMRGKDIYKMIMAAVWKMDNNNAEECGRKFTNVIIMSLFPFFIKSPAGKGCSFGADGRI